MSLIEKYASISCRAAQMDEDEVRQELDRLLLCDVLGFGEETHLEVHTGLRILRERLCAEPSIHGGR